LVLGRATVPFNQNLGSLFIRFCRVNLSLTGLIDWRGFFWGRFDRRFPSVEFELDCDHAAIFIWVFDFSFGSVLFLLLRLGTCGSVVRVVYRCLIRSIWFVAVTTEF
jgi:hypothetical protein